MRLLRCHKKRGMGWPPPWQEKLRVDPRTKDCSAGNTWDKGRTEDNDNRKKSVKIITLSSVTGTSKNLD